MSLRVLLALHHRLAPGGGGSPGATLALGSALTDHGCKVDYFGYEHAFGHDMVDSIGSRLHFPWRLASYLRRRARNFDVLDVSSGDAWVWARRGRPGSTLFSTGKSPALITRSHGLEHTLDQAYRADAKAGALKLSWKYPLYHGGFRLWEVRQSLQTCDHAVMVNDEDRDYAVDVLGLSPLQVSVTGHGIGRQFMGLWEPTEVPADVPLKLIAIGPWISRKGTRTLIEAITRLHSARIPFVLTLAGTEADEIEVRSDFPAELRNQLRVIPQVRQVDLPQLLLSHHVFLNCSFAEGYSLELPAAMACGLAAITTRVGGASRLIAASVNGELFEPGDASAVVATLTRWATDRKTLHSIRVRAQQGAHRYDWSEIAAQTITLYERVLRRLAGESAPRFSASENLAPPNSIWQRNGKPSLSICICTTSRPAVLRRCLASIEQGDQLPAEVVVGDDTLDGTETAAVCGDFPFVKYVRGPRRGLCSNRNVVIAAASGDYVSLLDDDSEVTRGFVRLANELTASADGRTIFTGDVLEHGVDRVPPSNPTFWGHFGKPLAVMGQCETVHLNCNLFPRAAFTEAHFDERIVYGYEDMDLCQQMLASGYRIEYRRELLNLHLPPPKSAAVRKSQNQQADRARYYTSLKRYLLWQSRPLRAFAYAALAPVHQAAHHLLHRQPSQALVGFSDMSWALRQTLEYRKASRVSRMVVNPSAPSSIQENN